MSESNTIAKTIPFTAYIMYIVGNYATDLLTIIPHCKHHEGATHSIGLICDVKDYPINFAENINVTSDTADIMQQMTVYALTQQGGSVTKIREDKSRGRDLG